METERAPLEDGTQQGPISEGRAGTRININLAPNLGDKISEDAFIPSPGSNGSRFNFVLHMWEWEVG